MDVAETSDEYKMSDFWFLHRSLRLVMAKPISLINVHAVTDQNKTFLYLA